MQLAPATVSTIIAVLSVQGVNVTGDQVRSALASLVGETPPPSPANLQPGEKVIVQNHADGETETFSTIDAAREYIAYNSKTGYSGRLRDSSDFSAYIVRRELNVELEQATTVTFE
jgi:hypothetical protein